MFARHNVNWYSVVWLLGLCLLFFVACGQDAPAVPAITDTAVATPNMVLPTPLATAVVPTPVPPTATAVPTPTLEPLAALVNSQPIFLADYEKELARYEQAQTGLGLPLPTDYRATVLNSLIERSLITQAALSQGIAVTPDMVDKKLVELRSAAGDDANFVAWLEANQWTEAEFREDLAAEMVITAMRDQVTADVPYAVEQVHARYLQVDDPALADTIRQQIQAGNDFGFMAQQYSLDQATAPTGGDLGFFARGSLRVPEVETAAFTLQPGEVSQVIAVTASDGIPTYYLVQVIERDPQRPLDPNLRYDLLKQTFESWLQTQWEQANITRFVNTDA